MKTYINIEKSLNRKKISNLKLENTLAFTPVELMYDDVKKITDKFSTSNLRIDKIDHRNLNFYADLSVNVMIVIYRTREEFYWWKIRTKSPKYVFHKTKKFNEFNINQIIKKTVVVRPNWDAYQLVIETGPGESSLKEFIWSNRAYLKYNFENLHSDLIGTELEKTIEQSLKLNISNDNTPPSKKHLSNTKNKTVSKEKMSKEDMFEIVNQAKRNVKNEENTNIETNIVAEKVTKKTIIVDNSNERNNIEMIKLIKKLEITTNDLKSEINHLKREIDGMDKKFFRMNLGRNEERNTFPNIETKKNISNIEPKPIPKPTVTYNVKEEDNDDMLKFNSLKF